MDTIDIHPQKQRKIRKKLIKSSSQNSRIFSHKLPSETAHVIMPQPLIGPIKKSHKIDETQQHRLARLKAEIQNGQYEINLPSLADKMIALEKQLLALDD